MAIYLFIFYCLFFIILFIAPSYLTFKQTGIHPFRFTEEDTTINYVGKVYKIISAISFVTLLINALIPGLMQFLIPIEYLESELISWFGLFMIHLAFVLIFIAQRNMSNEWRIGIDDTNRVHLVTKGMFSISRNPIFLGVLVVFLGLFLIMPNIITAIILITGMVVIQTQVRLEEEFLENVLGVEYKVYRSKVRRWL
ncbi:DUF1295 domain-containing protein [Flammeovirga yaeyamensis]|uniref:DUF1295 domain-containing protein n=1 Tax=Flammeovirga yaeyamensis TaxID=367791 RepID=A0AAX1N964_9BACT|nr:isoprenylcysteine carboxylmethyltransferase family protein [Flammeovirga yaeyamensis]MBB3699495.1 protein-S-isoprenylcysteine O-methyltransferase Ste14 [Flammeovirga yaeyamensis]NMF35248.1 isoprenylcysteine carboxylmethyltransferase family protein [Flammeovirga yaeyamensis]QWG04109.1 DUF1295 domain-containing protein [Flammeovirga yaeyamensis]